MMYLLTSSPLSFFVVHQIEKHCTFSCLFMLAWFHCEPSDDAFCVSMISVNMHIKDQQAVNARTIRGEGRTIKLVMLYCNALMDR